MSGIKLVKDQQGGALLNTLLFIILLGVMSASMVILVVADTRMMSLNFGERRAFYSAISGLEYATRAINEYAASNLSISSLHGYTENLSTGDGTYCTLSVSVIGMDSVVIDAKGFSQNASKLLRKGYNYIDVAKYAVYSGGTVTKVNTTPAGSIVQNASVMPFFDLDELRTLASPARYYPGSLTVTTPFSVPTPVAFIEGSLSLEALNLLTVGNFTVMGDIALQPWLFNFSQAVFLQPSGGTTLTCSMPLILGYFINGGIISNGNVQGYTKPAWAFWILDFRVTHDRNVLNGVLQYTVNGGPLIYQTNRMQILH